MDTIPGISKNAVKKCCQHETHTATNSQIPATTSDTSLPAITTLGASETTTTTTDNLEYPDKAIEDL